MNEGISRLVWDLDEVMREFGKMKTEHLTDGALLTNTAGPEIKIHKNSRATEALHESPYTNSGRLASVFLADFLD